jgi:UDP-MurNAc hydroxylase
VEFRILSHACLLVKSESHSIIVDPWLLGSCYWRSWWNFPRAAFDPDELAEVDAVVISHVHWDHWHGATLKRFFKGKPVIVPDEPSQRSRKDLQAIGFSDVRAVPHGETIAVGDIKLTLYQFGLLLNDAAVVIEADGVKLLDANDAKIAGMSLSNLVARHGPFDFALRSHSSANPRICFEVTGADEPYVSDDRDHYFRSFVAFMDAVRPRYAIPFASNHCHLHPDVYHLNSYISNPLELREYVARSGGDHPWSLQVMLPGSRWSSRDGFALSDEAPFNDLPATLARYRDSLAATFDKTERSEEGVKIGGAVWRRFQTMLAARPRRWPAGAVFALTLRWPSGRKASWLVEPREGRITERDVLDAPEPGLPLMEMPALVFRDAVLLNMFHHAGISKRCRFLATSKADLDRLSTVFAHLERVELGFLPLRRAYLGALGRTYVRRWRELFVYAQAFWLMKIKRKPAYIAEEDILASTSR